jgi:predicted transcriptional regulator
MGVIFKGQLKQVVDYLCSLEPGEGRSARQLSDQLQIPKSAAYCAIANLRNCDMVKFVGRTSSGGQLWAIRKGGEQ